MIALARKYRPRTFAEVAVQSHVSNTLRGAVAGKRVAHGYLLAGPRGVGKTTLARILAMALNCDRRAELDANPATAGEPCGECTSCSRIWAGSASMDVVEIDAASNRGVDDARELRERAMYAPSGDDRYKVYIVDEAHMLTREAWNALLKILEEPPPRVVFVFATTEPHRIAQSAAPVLSRLQRFDFKRIGPTDIRSRLETVLDREKVRSESDAVAMISRAADGSMRDALSLADQALAMGDGSLTAARTREALGLVPEDEYVALLDVIAERRAGDVFKVVSRLAEAGVDFGQFFAGLGEILRAQLSVTLGGEAPEVSDATRQALQARRAKLQPADLVRMLNILGEMEIRFKRSGQQQLLIETLLVRFALLDRTVVLEDVLKAIANGGEGGGGGGGGGGGASGRGKAGVISTGGPVLQALPTRADDKPSAKRQLAPDITAITGKWEDLITRVRAAQRALLAAALEASSPHAVTAAGEITVKLDEPNDFHARAIEQGSAELLAVLSEWFSGLQRVTLWRDTSERATPTPSATPRRVTEEMVKEERLNALRRKDPVLDMAIQVLDLEMAD